MLPIVAAQEIKDLQSHLMISGAQLRGDFAIVPCEPIGWQAFINIGLRRLVSNG